MRHLASSLVAAVVVTWRVLPETLDARTRIVHLVVLPALWSLFYVAMVHGAGPSLPSPGDAVAAAAAVAGLGSTVAVAVLFVEDRFESTAPLLVAASGGTGAIWAGRVLTVCALATVTAVVGVVPVLFLTGGPRGPGGWATTAVVLACAAPAGIGPGLVLGAMGLRLPDALLPVTAAEYLLPLLVGVVAPLDAVPGIVRPLAVAVPLTHVVQAAREGAVHGWYGTVHEALAVAAIGVVAWTALAMVVHRWGAAAARRSGMHDEAL